MAVHIVCELGVRVSCGLHLCAEGTRRCTKNWKLLLDKVGGCMCVYVFECTLR